MLNLILDGGKRIMQSTALRPHIPCRPSLCQGHNGTHKQGRDVYFHKQTSHPTTPGLDWRHQQPNSNSPPRLGDAFKGERQPDESLERQGQGSGCLAVQAEPSPMMRVEECRGEATVL